MRFVSINSARPGTYLAKTLFDDEGRILLKEGMQLTDGLLKRIRSTKIYSIYINDEYSDNEIEDIIKPEFRQKAIGTLKNAFDSFQKYSEYIVKNDNSPKRVDVINSRDNYLRSIRDISYDLLDQILNQRDVLINLVDIKSMDNYTYQHSVNVAVISVVLGIHLQLNKQELFEVCMGALLHDVGKIFIPTEIIQKQASLTEEEYTIVKEHTTKGYDYLKRSYDISGAVRIITLQHHEKINGKGYPGGLMGEEINKLSKIVAIADTYDAITSDRPYRKALPPNEALELIMGSGGTSFDYEMVMVFARTIIPYPEGCVVKLSDGRSGVVVENHPDFPLRPLLRIVNYNDSTEASETGNVIEATDIEYVDLFNQIDLVIAGIHT